MKPEINVIYFPAPLRSMREICDAMGVGERTVKRWISEGAPIAQEGYEKHVRYSAELAMLLAWRANKKRQG